MKTYNTGRVQIGLAYVPTPRPYHDRDALRLQDALLNNVRQTDWDGVAIVAGVCILCALAAWSLA